MQKAKRVKDFEAAFESFLEIRIALLRQGQTINEWARRNEYHTRTVHYAITRSHQGRLSIEIRRKLKAELGL